MASQKVEVQLKNKWGGLSPTTIDGLSSPYIVHTNP